jgi:hypothetical protein
MLKTEQNTPATEKKVLTAARKHFGQSKGITAVFDHGQWWVNRDNGEGIETYSVIDAEGPGTTNGFDFEQV